MKIIVLDNNGEIIFQHSTSDDDAEIDPPELVKENVIDALIAALKVLGIDLEMHG